MSLLEKYLYSEIPELNGNNVRLNWIGRREELPPGVLNALKNGVDKLNKNTGLTLNLAINYGGRAEIVDAVKKIIPGAGSPGFSGKIDEKNFESLLYTHGLPPLDLLIRTAGEMRISNFLLWQIAYAELWVTPACWPDFTPVYLLKAILDYQSRQRKFGNV
jgi:undecaprenyl diphosphate synthase